MISFREADILDRFNSKKITYKIKDTNSIKEIIPGQYIKHVFVLDTHKTTFDGPIPSRVMVDIYDNGDKPSCDYYRLHRELLNQGWRVTDINWANDFKMVTFEVVKSV